jgi:hypothetical protein
MPLETSVIDTLRAASSWGVVACARSQWSARLSSRKLSRVGPPQLSATKLVSMPTSSRQDGFLAVVLLKSTANVYNEVYNGQEIKVKNTEKTRGYHG